MAKHRTHRTHDIAFKRQVVQEYLAGETLHGLARRHDLSRTLIRIWVDKYEASACCYSGRQNLLEAIFPLHLWEGGQYADSGLSIISTSVS